jgi:hypothetical protein
LCDGETHGVAPKDDAGADKAEERSLIFWLEAPEGACDAKLRR